MIALAPAATHAQTVRAWVTSGDQSRLLARSGDAAFAAGPAAKAGLAMPIIEVNPAVRYQEMVGFGAAITDASAWLIQTRMNEQQRGALLRELFGYGPVAAGGA